MIDQGLVFSLIVIALTVAAVARLAPPRTMPPSALFDAGVVAGLGGVLTGRAVALLLDDPSGLTRLSDFVILRGGVEFWPGLAAGVSIVVVGARRDGIPVIARLADLAPYGLATYAVYEATCVARDGCFGPRSPFGLRPAGIGSRQFPVAVVVALAVAALAVAARRRARLNATSGLLLAVGGLASVRSVAAIWLPRIGNGPTRQHLESIVVMLATAGVALIVSLARARRLPVAGRGG